MIKKILVVAIVLFLSSLAFIAIAQPFMGISTSASIALGTLLLSSAVGLMCASAEVWAVKRGF